MRKRLIALTQESIRTHGEGWLDVERAAVVEITSEDKKFPIESAFGSREGPGWRASGPAAKRFAWSSISRKGSGAYP